MVKGKNEQSEKIIRTRLRYNTGLAIIQGFKVTMINTLRALMESRQHARTERQCKQG